MIFDWSADPSPGEVDDPPASGEIDAPTAEAALAQLLTEYPSGEWSLTIIERYVPPPPGTPMSGD